jgi:Domain of unknown function (DUF4396)
MGRGHSRSVDRLATAFDVAAHPQHMKIMNVVWPITGLYLPIAGWLLYAEMARRKPMRDMHAGHGGRPFWKSVFVSTTHCAAGCVIGDIIGAPTVFWAGWTLFGSQLYAEFLVLFSSPMFLASRSNTFRSAPCGGFRGVTRSLKRSRPTHSH